MKTIRCAACAKPLTKRSAVVRGAAMGVSKFCHTKCYPALWACNELRRPGVWIEPYKVLRRGSWFRKGGKENLLRALAGETPI